ncbi:MAG: CBS domain-containing protein [Candidatus Aenigmarchaeota archaeon]|nr:CBS domain-containing protein [Candidatus Aenigmarchaeota archaeon]
MKLVKDYMEKKVKIVKPSDSIFKVAKFLSKHDISGAPVVSGKKVLGVISETDLIKFMKLDNTKNFTEFATEPHTLTIALIELLKETFDMKEKTIELKRIRAKDFMTKGAISVGPNEGMLEAATIMESNKIDRLLVIDRGKLVGIISRLDLIRSLID